MFLFIYMSGMWASSLCCSVSGMELNADLVRMCTPPFFLTRQAWTALVGSLGFPRQREEAVCQCNAYSPNVITCDRDKEGHILPFKFISLCKVLLPFNHFQGELLPWGLLSRWMGSREVRPSSDACWFVFSHPFSCQERREVQRRVEGRHFEPLQSHPRQ